jgi:Arc/MetJ family transcription regulator
MRGGLPNGGLTNMHESCIYIHMRTTLNIDDEMLERASKLTGIKEKTALVRLGLEALIARESSRRLAKLGGSEKDLASIPRRRT